MNHNGKKLLLLGGTSLAASDIVNVAKKLGIYVIVADNVGTSLAKQAADEAWNISTADVEGIVSLAEKNHVNGVIAGVSEFNTLRQMEIAGKLKLPCYLSDKLWDMCMNKKIFKSICESLGVPVAVGLNKEQVLDEGFTGFPIIIKPVDGCAGEGISICNNMDEAIKGIDKAEKLSSSGRCVIEKYYFGEEVTMFYVAQDGEISLMAMGDRHVKRNQQGVIPLPVGYTFPSKYQAKYIEELDAKVINMLKKIGMKDGVLFIQSLVCDGEFVLYETGYRLNGCQEFRIIKSAENIDILELLVNYALTGRMSDRILADMVNPNFIRPHLNITFLVKPGRIGDIKGLEEVRGIPGVIAVHQMLYNGDIVKAEHKGTLHQVAVRVFAYAETKPDLKNLICEITQKIVIIDEKGSNMLLEGFTEDMY